MSRVLQISDSEFPDLYCGPRQRSTFVTRVWPFCLDYPEFWVEIMDLSRRHGGTETEMGAAVQTADETRS